MSWRALLSNLATRTITSERYGLRSGKQRILAGWVTIRPCIDNTTSHNQVTFYPLKHLRFHNLEFYIGEKAVQGFTFVLKIGCPVGQPLSFWGCPTTHFWLPDSIIAKTYRKTFGCPVGQPGVNFWLPDRKKWLPRATGQPVMWNPAVTKHTFRRVKPLLAEGGRQWGVAARSPAARARRPAGPRARSALVRASATLWNHL